ncbi:MAG TPA: hypothetical protein DCR27_03580 [Lachnospiraceae bacterium]|nr:hypothetical protein [Lachnospiraceae bacterium]
MKQRKLNYHFHNPNSAEDTADFLCKLLIEVNADKVERALKEAALNCAKESEYIAEPEDIEKIEESVSIGCRRAR